MTAATTGINETTAQKAGLDIDTVILSPMSHAGYYPGGKVMTMKVIFEKETYRLLGAQIVGYEGVDKRIDVLATAIHARIKGAGSGVCTAVFISKRSGKHGRIYGRKYCGWNFETMVSERY